MVGGKRLTGSGDLVNTSVLGSSVLEVVYHLIYNISFLLLMINTLSQLINQFSARKIKISPHFL